MKFNRWFIPLTLSFCLVWLFLTLVKAPDVQEASAAWNHLAANSDNATLVFRFGENDPMAREISFTAPINNLNALQIAHMEVITKDYGFAIAVCSINGVGCPESDCFCDPDGKYWAHFTWKNDQWDLGDGAAGLVKDNSVEAWSWQTYGDPALQPGTAYVAALKALDWLAGQQGVDGGYGTESSSAESLLSIGANNLPAADWRLSSQDPSLLGYFIRHAISFAGSGGGQSGKLAVGLSATSACWPRSAAQPMQFYFTQDGSFSNFNFNHAYAMLGLAALDQSIPVTSTQHLKNLRQPNGGWEWSNGWGTDTNTTALAIQAFIAAGEPVTASEILSGLNYLASAQNTDGGFPYDPNSPWGTESDPNSTAYVIQAILSVGQDPITGTWVISQTNPIAYLLDMQLPDGSIEFSKGLGGNLYATQQAIPALMGVYNPADIKELDSCPTAILPLLFR